MRKRVLVVEDNVEFLRPLCLRLRAAGFSVSTALDGAKALEKARTLHPDVILLDFILPEIDGFAVCEALQRDPGTARIPIIGMSGLQGQFARLHGIEAGATDFFAKPFQPSNLIDRINQVLTSKTEPAPSPAEAPLAE
jgi:DNA-binding response OmpR family regulator